MCAPCCPTPRAARVYFLAMLIVALILLGFSLWELLYANSFVSSGGSCGFPLPASAVTQGWVNLAAAATLGLTSLLFGALACVGVTCCTEVIATVIHILAAVVVLVDNAYMSIVVFQQNRWPASYDGYTGTAVLNCDTTFYRSIAGACARAPRAAPSNARARADARHASADPCAPLRAVYIMGLWLGVLVLPPLVSLITHCLCGCAVDEHREEDAAKRGGCCGSGGRGEQSQPLTGAVGAAAGVPAGGNAPKLD